MPLYKIVEFLISKIKKEEYRVSYPFNIREIVTILLNKSFSVTRGFLFIKPFIAESKGAVFAEKAATILYGHKLKAGSGLNLMEGACINALSSAGVVLGNNFTLGRYAIIECTGVFRNVGDQLIVGDNVGINHYCYIGVRGTVIIGDNVIFGPRVNLFSENHNFNDLDTPIKHQGTTKSTTIIGDDVWIGANVTILPGVTIGEGCVIGAGSVVTRDIKPFSVVGGVPAKTLKMRV